MLIQKEEIPVSGQECPHFLKAYTPRLKTATIYPVRLAPAALSMGIFDAGDVYCHSFLNSKQAPAERSRSNGVNLIVKGNARQYR